MNPYRLSMTLIALSLPCIAAQAHAQDHGGHARASEPTAPSPLAIPLDAHTRASLPRAQVTATAHGKSLDCEGVELHALLQKANALPAELRGPALASYVLVTARDDYRVVYALAEFDPSLGKNRAVLADRCDGQPLGEEDGPLRLVAPSEARPARWVRQVKSVTVVRAP